MLFLHLKSNYNFFVSYIKLNQNKKQQKKETANPSQGYPQVDPGFNLPVPIYTHGWREAP